MRLLKEFSELANMVIRTLIAMLPVLLFADVDSGIKSMYIFFLMMFISYVMERKLPAFYKIITTIAILLSVTVVALYHWGFLSYQLSDFQIQLILVMIAVGLPFLLTLIADTGHELAMAYAYSMFAYFTFLVLFGSTLGTSKLERFIRLVYQMCLITVLISFLHVFLRKVKVK